MARPSDGEPGTLDDRSSDHGETDSGSTGMPQARDDGIDCFARSSGGADDLMDYQGNSAGHQKGDEQGHIGFQIIG